MSNLITIEGEERTETGKGYSRKLRTQGMVPANLIGGGKPSVLLQVQAKNLSKAWKSGRQFNLSFKGETKVVKMQEMQIQAESRKALHVDLMYV